jgi:hypothetical protein
MTILWKTTLTNVNSAKSFLYIFPLMLKKPSPCKIGAIAATIVWVPLLAFKLYGYLFIGGRLTKGVFDLQFDKRKNTNLS